MNVQGCRGAKLTPKSWFNSLSTAGFLWAVARDCIFDRGVIWSTQS